MDTLQKLMFQPDALRVTDGVVVKVAVSERWPESHCFVYWYNEPKQAHALGGKWYRDIKMETCEAKISWELEYGYRPIVLYPTIEEAVQDIADKILDGTFFRKV